MKSSPARRGFGGGAVAGTMSGDASGKGNASARCFGGGDVETPSVGGRERKNQGHAEKGRAPEKHREGGEARMGRTIEKQGLSEPQEERGNDKETNDESGADWGAGGELTVIFKRRGARP